MAAHRFAHLDTPDFRAFEMLETPIYIYGFSKQRILWANHSALQFWDAGSLAELQERKLTPYSQSTKRRLKYFLAAFHRGEQRAESWTYYPKGIAVSAFARCRGVSLAGEKEAMLVEIQSLDPASMPDYELRAIEALRHTPVMVSMIDDDGAVLLRNPAATDFLLREDRSDGSDSNGIEDLRKTFAESADFEWLLKQARDAGEASRTVRMAKPYATFHSVQLTRINDPATGNPATLWVQQDVSQLRDVSLQLAASEAALDIVLGLSAAPSLLVSASNGQLLRANSAAGDCLHLEIEESLRLLRIFADEGMQTKFFDAVQAHGSHLETASLIANDGRTFWAAVLGTRLPLEDGDTILLVISNIDELHKAAADLEVALNLERGISEMQRRVLEIASHEFRTPLAVIDGAARRIERRSRSMAPGELEELADRIRKFVKALNSLLDKTIERAKRNLAGVHCEKSPGLVQHAIADICSSFARRAEIEIDSSIQTLPQIWFDRVLFDQALINLVENAIKYSPGQPRIWISAVLRPAVLELYLRDWGIGILPEDRDHVFEERTRGSNVGVLPGSGLGLFIVRAIFRSHGGDISVIDTPGPGTTIKIVLPLGQPAPTDAIV